MSAINAKIPTPIFHMIPLLWEVFNDPKVEAPNIPPDEGTLKPNLFLKIYKTIIYEMKNIKL